MIAPLYNLKGTIDALIQWVKDDFNKFEEEYTWLYQFVHYKEREEDVEDFYRIAKEIFLRSNGERNILRVVFEYPKDTTLLPCILLREPIRDNGDTNNIGELTPSIIGLENGFEMQVYRDVKFFNYDLMCVGINYIESIVISEVMYGLMVGAYETFARSYEKVSFSLRELAVRPEMNPYPTFIRTIGVALQCSYIIPSIQRFTTPNSIKFKEKILKK